MAIKLFVFPQLAAQVNTSGLATEAKQDVIITELQTVDTSVQAVDASVQSVDISVQAVESAVQAVDAELVLQTAELIEINTELDTQTAELQTLSAVDYATSAKQDLQTTELQQIEAEITAVKNKMAAALFTLPYDTLQVVSKTADGPTQIVSKTGGLAGSIVQTLDIEYDLDGEFESAVVS